jgi:SAM-dependent methyltransferase
MKVFDQYAQEYDHWFDENERIYQAEVNALRRVIPHSGNGIEVGAGTGRFSLPFGIELGVEPSRRMAAIARRRGLKICQATGELLPFPGKQFDYVLLVTVICFVSDMLKLLREIHRVLAPGGLLINAFIDRNSALGRVYESHKNTNKFYRQARFYSAEQVADCTRQAGFSDLIFLQTILGLPAETQDFDRIQSGYGGGAFVVLSARKS